jgi:hypothetical protein
MQLDADLSLNGGATMLEEPANEAHYGALGNINSAAELLRRTLLEFDSLAGGNARLHFALSISGHSIRQRLDLLSGIAEVLKGFQAPARTLELRHRAKRLIAELVDEFERLAVVAEHGLQ